MSVLACMILVLAMAVPVSAESDAFKSTPGTTTCSGCGATASFYAYGLPVEYKNNGTSSHDEKVEVYYYCKYNHRTTLYDWIKGQSHKFTSYDNLGHTGSNSDTHQYWLKCKCGYGENAYVDCSYRKTGVHTKPF